MSDATNDFSNRLKAVERKHAKLARGYSCKVGRDGLIVFKPKRRKIGFPWRTLAMVVVGFLAFKGLVIAQMGTETYDQRISEMSAGPLQEQIGAFVMQPDPVAEVVARNVAPYF
ncbi:hypothetical protein ACM25N_08515 [Roseovarius sp. C7]|uniref:hypothetical protein n=1 Tax=Roseovarius sp. C7 TaxID=3398643 RepID=UPI0039F682BF